MATGREMLDAVIKAIHANPGIKELRLSPFDVYDLFKLTPIDLLPHCDSRESADAVSSDLSHEHLDKLSELLGVKLTKYREQKNLIPGEGIRRQAGAWANDPVLSQLTLPETGPSQAPNV